MKYNKTSQESELLQQMSRLSLENIPTDTETSQDEQVELDQWKKEDVYTEHIDEGQDCISFRWVLKEKVANGEKLVKTRLCAQ